MHFLLLIFFFLLPLKSLASFSKPELLARFMSTDAWNAPDNLWCFGGEPAALKDKVYLNCINQNGGLMISWDQMKAHRILAQASEDSLFSKPVSSFGKISWYEFNEVKTQNVYQSFETVEKIELKNLAPLGELVDSFLPLFPGTFFFRRQGEEQQLLLWSNHVVSSFYDLNSSYLFTPYTGTQGEIALKVRVDHLGEDAPDRLWSYDGQWKVALEDREANSRSKWRSFRQQMAIDGNKILVVAKDDQGEALILIHDSKVEVIAREGIDLRRFDFFAPKMRRGILVIRGEDFSGNKAIYVKDDGPFRKLISEGDIVNTDLGAGRIHYPQKDSVFYGAPGIDELGNIYLQATLTDPDYETTLLGIGLIKLRNE